MASDGMKFTNLPPMKSHQRGLDAKKSDVLKMPGQGGGDGGGQDGDAQQQQQPMDGKMDAGFAEAHAQGMTPEQVAQAYSDYCSSQDGQQGHDGMDDAEYE